jgi:hypothetical protein
MSLAPARVTKDVADDFVARLHRHHDPDQGCRFVVGVWDVERDKLCGVGVVGRPRARAIDQEGVVEVTRCCTDGTANACSFIYARAANIARDCGFRAIITYTLSSEGGASLRALGWWGEQLDVGSQSWSNRAGREDAIRADTRWLCLLNAECFVAEPRVVVSSQLALEVA